MIHNYCNKLLYLYINAILKDIKMNKNYFEIARKNMVTNQILPVGVKNKTLIESFDNIKRELFITSGKDDLIYSDSDIKFTNKRNFTRSFILAKMFEHCNFSKDDKILIIGCLTGYSVAILSNLVGYVFAVENDKKIVEIANKTLSELNLLNCSVHYKNRLNHGNSKNAPYDKIFIEGSVTNIPMSIVNQLKENGLIYTVIKSTDDPIGFFVKGLKVKNGLSYTKIFNTKINDLSDFINESEDYVENN